MSTNINKNLLVIYNPKPGDGPPEYSDPIAAIMGDASKVHRMLDDLDDDDLFSADDFVYWAKTEYISPVIFKFYLVKGLYCTQHLSPLTKYELWCDQVYHVLGPVDGRDVIEAELKTTIEQATYDDKIRDLL